MEQTEPEVNASAPQLLPLDAPRSVAVRIGKEVRTWHFRRISQKDWEQFFEGITHRVLRHAGVEERVFDADTPLIELVDRALSTTVGYPIEDDVEDWRQSLPLAHKRAVGAVLRSVTRMDAEGSLNRWVEIPLGAAWASDEHGKTEFFTGLVHRFRHPSIDVLRKFNLECARTRIVGTGEEGVTIYPVRQAIAMRLYDELIESVDGYSFNGEPLSGVEAIRREMDGSHKATAALALFEPAEPVETL